MTESNPYKDMRARDAEVERRYVFERDGMGVLPWVSAHQEELAKEYLDWRLYGARGTIREDLTTWEHHRFGGELIPSAHAVLLCAVLVEAYPDDPKSRIIRGTSAPKAT